MDKKNDVIEWLGVPYAKSPVGELRSKAPQKADKWEKTKDVSKYGDTAIQFSNGEVKGSEDALNLDVVRPNNSKEDLPVVVYLHGGNNQLEPARKLREIQLSMILMLCTFLLIIDWSIQDSIH